MTMYEVDLRSRKTGDFVECIFFTKNYDEAWQLAKKWNEKNLSDYDKEQPGDSYIDGSEGYVANVYELQKRFVHGAGNMNLNENNPLNVTLEQLFQIFSFNDTDEVIVYDTENFAEYVRDEKTGLNKVNYYYPGIFILKPSLLKVSTFLNPKYAFATVMYCEHCEDGKFRVVLDLDN